MAERRCANCNHHTRKFYGDGFCSPKCEKQFFKRQAKKDFTSKRWHRKRLLNHSNICGICGKPITSMKDATIDHIIPLSKGGADDITNMQIAHAKCNRDKGDSYDAGTSDSTISEEL